MLFLVERELTAGYPAKAVGDAIFTEGDTFGDLCANVREAVETHFDESTAAPEIIRLEFRTVDTFARDRFLAALDQAPDVPPIPGDELTKR